MKKYVIAFSIITSLFCLPMTGKAEDELAPGYDICIEGADNTSAMIECATNALQYWDKILNKNYASAKKQCSEDSEEQNCEKQLLNAQRLWIQYKEEMAQVINRLKGGGTLARLEADIFVTRETKKQALLLNF